MSSSSVKIVPFATPVMRPVERMEFPSTRAATTATCLEKGSLFMSDIMLERSWNVKENVSSAECSSADLQKRYINFPRKRPIAPPHTPKRVSSMTIAAGFRCLNGVVEAADSDCTPGQSKFRDKKIFEAKPASAR